MTSIDKHFHWRLSHDLQKNQLRSTVDVTALLRPLPRHLPMVLFDAQVSPSPDNSENSDNTLEHIMVNFVKALPFHIFSRSDGLFAIPAIPFWISLGSSDRVIFGDSTAHSKFESPLSCGQTVRSHRFFQGLLRLSPN